MAILESYSVPIMGGHSFKSDAYPNGSYMNESVGRNALLRVGTGSRRKPDPIDETAYTREQLNILAPSGSGSWKAGGQYYIWSGHLPYFNTSNLNGALQNPSGAYDNNIGDVARLQALSQFNQRDLDLGTAWKERGKTADLIRGVATTGIEALNDIRKKDGRGLLNTLGLDHSHARARGVVDASLAYHYGMKPLLQDVAGAVQALARNKPEQWRILAKGAYADERKQSRQVGLGSFFPYQADSRLRLSNRTKISAVQRPLTREQDLLWSLGLDNPLGTAWEVTPYSFVVDWLLPVGDWLGALNSIKYYDGWQTVSTDFIEETMVATGSKGTVSGFIFCDTTVSGGLYKMKRIRRRVLNSLPLVGLPIKDPFSVDHMAKALSLLASRSANGGLPPTIRY